MHSQMLIFFLRKTYRNERFTDMYIHADIRFCVLSKIVVGDEES